MRRLLAVLLVAACVPAVSAIASPSSPVTCVRLAGADRIDTAVAVSKNSYPQQVSAAVAVLARADNFADTFPGTPLAAAKDGPLLLTGSAALDSRARAELQRVLAPSKTVYLMGGTAALSPQVENEVRGMNYDVMRLSGTTRYDTAVKAAGALGNPTTDVLADGDSFPDGLSAGPAASKLSGAILLTAGSTMPPETAAYLQAYPPDKRYAIGVRARQADPSATGVAGPDRYQTAVAVAQAFFQSPAFVAVTTGENFIDALSGGAHAARQSGPLLTTSSQSLPGGTHQYLATVKDSVTSCAIYGGSVAVSNAVKQQVEQALNT
jgi:hypothetical protein